MCVWERKKTLYRLYLDKVTWKKGWYGACAEEVSTKREIRYRRECFGFNRDEYSKDGGEPVL